MTRKSYKAAALAYARAVTSGEKIAGKEIVQSCARFLKDIERDDMELRSREPDLVISIIEKTMVHKQGETLTGESLLGKPLRLEPWQIFLVYNLLGFYYKNSDERRYKEAFIMIPRKNGKRIM